MRLYSLLLLELAVWGMSIQEEINDDSVTQLSLIMSKLYLSSTFFTYRAAVLISVLG